MRSVSEDPFLDRWTYFFCDLFRNGQLLQEGINTFYDYIYKTLTLNIPYDDFVRDMITASAVSTWTNGPANFLARNRVFEGDGYVMNQEDTDDEIAITTGRLFLGVNLECISCHDGKGHLEKINLWLAHKKRADVWREASFFGKTYISPEFGRFPQFIVKDTRKGYDLTTISSIAPAPESEGRHYTDLHPGWRARVSRREGAAGLCANDHQQSSVRARDGEPDLGRIDGHGNRRSAIRFRSRAARIRRIRLPRPGPSSRLTPSC